MGCDHRYFGHKARKQKLTGCGVQVHDTRGYDYGDNTPTTVQSERRSHALFKPAKKAAAPAIEWHAIPNTKELVSLKIDSDILAHFQADGPGWQ
jgi:uncharacterized protein (DUF4415 family)